MGPGWESRSQSSASALIHHPILSTPSEVAQGPLSLYLNRPHHSNMKSRLPGLQDSEGKMRLFPSL